MDLDGELLLRDDWCVAPLLLLMADESSTGVFGVGGNSSWVAQCTGDSDGAAVRCGTGNIVLWWLDFVGDLSRLVCNTSVVFVATGDGAAVGVVSA